MRNYRNAVIEDAEPTSIAGSQRLPDVGVDVGFALEVSDVIEE